MICQICKNSGLKSTIQNQGGHTTLLGYNTYYDEGGVYHDHDPNTITSGYRCSNGHLGIGKSKRRCPSCDYGQEISIEWEDGKITE